VRWKTVSFVVCVFQSLNTICPPAHDTDSRVFCLVMTVWTGDAGVLAELMSLAMSRYKCSDSPLDDNELNEASLCADDERLCELDNGRPLPHHSTQWEITK